MAPVCVAVRLLLSVLFLFILVLSLLTGKVNALLTYDRQELLDIQLTSGNLIKFDRGHKTFPPPLLAGIPAHLLHVAALPPGEDASDLG